jgi:hypothetical protein
MKKFNKTLAIVAMVIGITSCADESTLTETLSQDAQLKSYSLTTAGDGSYILEHTLSDGISSTIISNTSGNEVVLSEGHSDSKNKTSVLPLINSEIKIDFITENEVKIPGITILDEKTYTTAKSKDIDYVTDYGVSLLTDGSYLLDFTLVNNYIPTYVFNEELDRHEIILVTGISNGNNSYSKNFLKFEGQKLNIVFLRSLTTTTLNAKKIARHYPEPPEITID